MFLTTVLNFFKRILFSPRNAINLEAALKAAQPLIPIALEIVTRIAELTPTKADDNVIAVLKHFGIDRVLSPTEDRATVLRDVAVQVVSERVGKPATKAVLNLAIELALSAFQGVKA